MDIWVNNVLSSIENTRKKKKKEEEAKYVVFWLFKKYFTPLLPIVTYSGKYKLLSPNEKSQPIPQAVAALLKKKRSCNDLLGLVLKRKATALRFKTLDKKRKV